MVRSLIIAVGAALLSWMLLYLSLTVWLSRTRSGNFARDPHALTDDYATVKKQYGNPFELMNEGQKEFELGVFPIISIIIGAIVGLTVNTRAGWIAIFSLVPLQIFLLVASSFAVGAWARMLVYFLLAYLSASSIGSIRSRSVCC